MKTREEVENHKREWLKNRSLNKKKNIDFDGFEEYEIELDLYQMCIELREENNFLKNKIRVQTSVNDKYLRICRIIDE